jgi:hypothetical protein
MKDEKLRDDVNLIALSLKLPCSGRVHVTLAPRALGRDRVQRHICQTETGGLADSTNVIRGRSSSGTRHRKAMQWSAIPVE